MSICMKTDTPKAKLPNLFSILLYTNTSAVFLALHYAQNRYILTAFRIGVPIFLAPNAVPSIQKNCH